MPSRKKKVPLLPGDAQSLAEKRRMLAAFLRTWGEQVVGPKLPMKTPRGKALSPRAQQTLHRMLAGDSEKQVAINMSVSPHTVHIYVKTIYRHFDVSSRGELLALFVAEAHRAPENRNGKNPDPQKKHYHALSL